MMRIGPAAQKVLLLLAAGITLSLSGSPRRYARVLRVVSREWQEINRQALYRAIRRLYESQLIDYCYHRDGSIGVILNRTGQKVILRFKLETMRIQKPKRWDRKWRIVIFDIPERHKRLRDTLRMRLKQIGMLELQKSVFVHPFECRNEVDFLIEFYEARRYVRFIEATHIDNEPHLKRKFQLL